MQKLLAFMQSLSSPPLPPSPSQIRKQVQSYVKRVPMPFCVLSIFRPYKFINMSEKRKNCSVDTDKKNIKDS